MKDRLSNRPCKLLNLWYPAGSGKIRMLTMKGLVEINSAAHAIWQQINGKNTVGDIVNNIHRENVAFNKTQIAEDVISVINFFADLEIIVLDWEPITQQSFKGALL